MHSARGIEQKRRDRGLSEGSARQTKGTVPTWNRLGKGMIEVGHTEAGIQPGGCVPTLISSTVMMTMMTQMDMTIMEEEKMIMMMMLTTCMAIMETMEIML